MVKSRCLQVTFIWHDCFLVETPELAMIFDYWLDESGSANPMPQALSHLDREKPLLVFVSHGHKDHYNPAVFGWASEFENISYIVSRDVWRRMRHVVSPSSPYLGPKIDISRVYALKSGEKADIGGVEVTAYPSTDIGNSYGLILPDGTRLFHAGDLNAWIWKEESTRQEIAKAMGDYQACLRDIAVDLGENLHFDVLFFPVDSRIGSEYWTGAAEFVRKFDVSYFFPMHFGLGDDKEREQRRKDAFRFDLYAASGEYIGLGSPGDVWHKKWTD